MQKTNPKKKIFKEQSRHCQAWKKKMDPTPEFDDDSTGNKALMWPNNSRKW